MKNRITLTDREMGALHELLIFGHNPERVPSLTRNSSPSQIEDWKVLQNLTERASGNECFCGDRCTCGG